MKKFVLILTCMLLVALCLTACQTTTVDYDAELLTNGTFDGNTYEGWTFSHSEDDSVSMSKLLPLSESADDYAEVGAYYLKLDGVQKFANFRSTVAIEKNATYRLSAKIRIDSEITPDEDESGLCGAFLAIASDYNLVSAIRTKQTDGWEVIETVFNSGEHTEVDVVFGIGIENVSGTETDRYAKGTACFDGISLKKVENAIGAIDLVGKASEGTLTAEYRTNNEGTLFMILTTVLGALCLYAAYAAFRAFMSRKDAFLTPESASQQVSFFKSSAFMLLICELLAFAVRLIVINFVNGGSTVSEYITATTKLVDEGAASFYASENVTIPIGTLYLLWMMGALAKPLNLVIGFTGFTIFLKIPAVLADLVIVFLIYFLANRKYNQYISAIFAGVYALFPTFFFLSSGWGAFASIGALFLLLSVISIVDKKYVMSVVYMAIALLFSTEVMLVLPLFLAYLGFVFFKSDDHKIGISISLTASIIGLYLISIPFILTRFAAGEPFIVLKNYCEAFLVHTGFTENAFTVYGLFGLGAKAANTASLVFNWLFVLTMLSYTIFLFFKSRSRLDLLLLFAFIFVFTFVMTSAVDILLIYPALILLLAYGLMTGDRRVLKLFGGLSLTTLVNTSYAMTIGGYFGKGTNSKLILMNANDPVLIIFSIFNLLLLAYFAYITISICIKEEIKGVVVIEGNYFKYVAAQTKKCYKAVVVFFKEKVPAFFKKKEQKEDVDAR